MGQSLSCGQSLIEQDIISAVQTGDIRAVESILQLDSRILRRSYLYKDLSLLHIAALKGNSEMLSLILERWDDPDVLNRHKQTPLMLAVIRGKTNCVEQLLSAGANILKFDSVYGRTCLHYAAYYGHSDCVQAILQAARSNPISESWGFIRFVNVRDTKGLTPLHLAAKQGQMACARLLLDKGALVSASSGSYGFPGSTPLHLAARRGSLECVRELLVRGADRLQLDSFGRTPYMIALKRNHICAALLNPSSAEPLVWPFPLKLIDELNPEVKILLEKALMEANRRRERKILKGTVHSLPSPAHSEIVDDDKFEGSSIELCCICFERGCAIEMQGCGHQMCAQCTLALCCHNKPKPNSQCLPPAPACPFCRGEIALLTAAKPKAKDGVSAENSPMRRTSGDGNCTFSFASAMGAMGRISAGSAGNSNMIERL